jgi:hypothetical protein
LYYSPDTVYTSKSLKEKIEEMEMIMMQNSLFESQQYINWGKLFCSAKMFAEGKTFLATEELEKTMEEYV